jgi:hypothetical protein
MNKPKKDVVVEKTTELAPVAEVTSLSVNLSERAMAQLQDQRKQLQTFVGSQLKEGMNNDYAKIPGTPKKSLLKPGAEKLANLFKLGSRILSKERDIDRESGFAMFNYTVEVYHIPTGAVISQCEGSANSEEKKFKGRAMADMLNTLQKMAQKRAYVGAVISAVGASDFFTQDIESASDLKTQGQEKAEAVQKAVQQEMREPGDESPECELCNAQMRRTKAGNAWYCPNFGDKSQGEHTYLKD